MQTLFLTHVLSHHMRPRCFCRFDLGLCVYFQPVSSVLRVRQTETDSAGWERWLKGIFLESTTRMFHRFRPINYKSGIVYIKAEHFADVAGSKTSELLVPGGLEIHSFRVCCLIRFELFGTSISCWLHLHLQSTLSVCLMPSAAGALLCVSLRVVFMMH